MHYHRLNSLAAKDLEYVLHPFTNLAEHAEIGPIVIDRSQGVRVWDDNGREFIDSLAGLWCASLGFDNERLVKAASDQMRKLPYYHSFTSKSHEPVIRLAEMLIERAPVKMSKAFFTNSGSEATEAALRMIWYFNNAEGRPEKKKIISRKGAYHGITVGAASVTGLPLNQIGFDAPMPGFFHLTTPHYYHNGLPGETEDEFATRCAEELEDLILKEGPETVAAMWAEPIMGAGGVIVPPKTYFHKIQKILKKYDVLLVVDEVICGFWRTGKYWGSTTFEIEPDLITCAKAMSAAYFPIGAVMIKEELFQSIKKYAGNLGLFGHGPTYSGHPVGAAVAAETLRIYDDLNIGDHVADAGAYMQKQLKERFSSHPLVGEIRGTGLMAGVEFVSDREKREKFDPAVKLNELLVRLMEQEGVIGRVTAGNVMCFSPPLIIQRDEIDIMLDRVEKAVGHWTNDVVASRSAKRQ